MKNMEMNLNNPWVYEELAKPENNTFLTDELIDRILDLSHDDLRQDLEQIIRYHICLGVRHLMAHCSML